jgi:hypothetical protein
MRKYLLISIIFAMSTASSVLATPKGHDCFPTKGNILICETDTNGQTKTKVTDREAVQLKKLTSSLSILYKKNWSVSARSLKLMKIKNELLEPLTVLQAKKKIDEFKGIYDIFSQLKIDKLELQIKILDNKIAEYDIESAEYSLAIKELQGERDSYQR